MTSADTIFALSSGAPPAAIAVIRVSGPGADAACRALGGDLPPPRRAALRTLRHDGRVLDSALVIRFPGPTSATGEDLVEFHLHGGRAVIAAVADALASLSGFRPAAPGEFTRRAFANGRIDLTEAEGLADLLAAETEAQRRAALMVAQGGLSAAVERWREAVLMAAARVEAAIDFADEDDVVPWPAAERDAVIGSLVDGVAATLASPPAERLRDGIRVVIAGPPNAGKSTLLNTLVAREAAITSPLAGTTRDVIEVPVQLGGHAFLFVDTAGLRDDSGDVIEAIGIDRARQELAQADIVLWLGDPAHPPDHPHILRIHAKADLSAPVLAVDHRVSARSGAGIDALVASLIARAAALLPAPDAVAINLRQRACLADVKTELEAARGADDLLLVAEHLRHARSTLDRLTGRAGVEDMLDALFGRFCIGK